ncbi:Uncharacterised protein [Sphingobacterium multivorum]|uniref:Uncharacterized protein n=1 Tax=Sphingobacterium multivorum TaxID=28454 RepID=A0A2X2LNG5_SPHMU|nr:Uncharacterised protein [Sphingobacterium multivorum]
MASSTFKCDLNACPEASKLVVLYFIFLAGLLHNPIERRIMNMADLWKKVMFNLKIEAAKQPGKCFAARSKICGGLNLMNHPFFLDL